MIETTTLVSALSDSWLVLLRSWAEVLGKHHTLRKYVFIVASPGFAVGLALVVAGVTKYIVLVDQIVTVVLGSFLSVASALALAPALVSLTPTRFFTLLEELEPIRAERVLLEERIEERRSHPAQQEAAQDVFDRLSIILNEQREYFTINKAQARRSFNIGVFFALIGLAIVTTGIGLFYSGSPNVTAPTMTAVAGLLSEFVAALGFYFYRQSLSQVTYFYDRLVRLQETIIAIRLAEAISGSAERNMARERVVMLLMERHTGEFGTDSGRVERAGRRTRLTARNERAN